eukprot:941068_1
MLLRVLMLSLVAMPSRLSSAGAVQIFIRYPSEKQLAVELPLTATVDDLYAAVDNTSAIVELSFGGATLKRGDTLIADLDEGIGSELVVNVCVPRVDTIERGILIKHSTQNKYLKKKNQKNLSQIRYLLTTTRSKNTPQSQITKKQSTICTETD